LPRLPAKSQEGARREKLMSEPRQTPTVINVANFRVPQRNGGPCVVTFMGFRFRTPEGREDHLNVSVTVPSGDYAGAIREIKNLGGMYLSLSDEGTWFLPWPCAAVRILPV
jgi:hypothetical protein